MKQKEIDLSELPRWESGRNKGSIDWLNSKGYIVRFSYDDIEGWIEIVDYNKKVQTLLVKYNKIDFKIKTNDLIKCKLGVKLGKITNNFHYNIGQTFIDNKRNLTIIDEKYKKDKNGREWKWYKYVCNKCGWRKGWIIEGHLEEGNGCGCCVNRTPVLGINTIWDTDKWMIPIINDDEFCKTHTHSCADTIYPTCPYCGRVKSKKMTINTIYGRHSIPCICNDTFSYPEKVMFGALEQLELNFEYHKTFEWSKNVQVDNKNLCGNKEYDFSFKYNNEEFLVETHGSQHYDKSKFSTMKGSRSFGEEISNDKLKKELAIKNSIKEENYIIIDCRNTYLKWIKQNILESKLNEIFDLNNVDWIEVEKFASNNLVKVACDYKNNNPQLFTGDISKMMNICQGTVTRYLKKGNKLGWCHYDINEEKVRNSEIQSLRLGKLVKCIDINKTFNSLSDCSKYFKDSLNIKLFSNCIGMVCNENLESYKGYHFVFV